MAQPMLGEVELQLVQNIIADEDQVLNLHSIPALEGDFFQKLGRRISRITLTGVITGTEAGEGLTTLREKFRAAEPVSFVADIATATKLDQVVIEAMDVRELAGKPERFEYALTLREFIASPQSLQEQPAIVEAAVNQDSTQQTQQIVENIASAVGELEVQVTLAGDRQNFTNIVVLVEGQADSGDRVTFVLEDQQGGVYSRDNVPAGSYTIKAFRR
ncbi:hypothetical protein [Myxacorys almedinensis]|uniref:Uncharacterized protein n=1 Tax=Myxacorys almedinensis A TaxID=2690445 RepID=A0A8J7Z9P8_9CYAN|nr:hypothetical protein [Myxacorys almedinensis]NDJ19003.1 hypothetical protein [Myxacorys almedinensis A]